MVIVRRVYEVYELIRERVLREDLTEIGCTLLWVGLFLLFLI